MGWKSWVNGREEHLGGERVEWDLLRELEGVGEGREKRRGKGGRVGEGEGEGGEGNETGE